MEMTFREDRSLQKRLEQARKQLAETRVEVGLPVGASSRNRWLLALHERGAPAAHIPPRPVVAPALARDDTRSAMADGLQSACEAAASGDPEKVQAGFEQTGQAGVEGIRSYIDAGIPPANSPLTISGGWIRNFSSGKPVFVPGKGFDKPLYATGELYNAFDFEIKK